MVPCPVVYEFAQQSTYLVSSTAREDTILPYNGWSIIAAGFYSFLFVFHLFRHGFGGLEQRFPVVRQRLLQHLLQQLLQAGADLPPLQPHGFQVVSVDGQGLQTQAPLLRLQRFQQLPDRGEVRIRLMLSGALAAHVRLLQGNQAVQSLPAVAGKIPAQQLPVGGQPQHMVVNEPDHLLRDRVGRFQPVQDRIRHFGAFPGVAVEMAPAGFVPGKGGDLAHIVQQRRPAEHRVLGHCLQDVGGVGVDIVGVVGRVLVKAHHGGKLGDHLGQNRGKPDEVLGSGFCQEAAQLAINPLPGQILHQRGLGAHGALRFRFDGQTEPGGKPDAPENSQGILPEPGIGVAYGPEDAVFNVFRSAKGVGIAPGGGPGHGIHGEIPPGQVLLNVGDEVHPVRVAVVRIGSLGAEGGDLHHAKVRDNAHGAVPHPGVHLGKPGKYRLGLLRQGAGAQVIVVGHNAHPVVPDTAAHGVGCKPGVLQHADALTYGLRELHIRPPPPGARRTWTPSTLPC